MDFDPGKFLLDRFSAGSRVYVWKKHQHTSAHGSFGIVRQGRKIKYVELESGFRVYGDSGAGFMSEEEYSVFDIMDV